MLHTEVFQKRITLPKHGLNANYEKLINTVTTFNMSIMYRQTKCSQKRKKNLEKWNLTNIQNKTLMNQNISSREILLSQFQKNEKKWYFLTVKSLLMCRC